MIKRYDIDKYHAVPVESKTGQWVKITDLVKAEMQAYDNGYMDGIENVYRTIKETRNRWVEKMTGGKKDD